MILKTCLLELFKLFFSLFCDVFPVIMKINIIIDDSRGTVDHGIINIVDRGILSVVLSGSMKVVPFR